MNRQNFFDTFQLYNYFFLNDQVEAVATIEFEAFIFDGQVDLPAEVNSSQMQFVTQTFLVSRFEQPRA